MKPSYRYTSLVAGAALVLAGSLPAQSGTGTPSTPSTPAPSNQPDTMRSDAGPTTRLHDIKRVTKDSVANRFTAKDLIGAAVYDPAGEKIGDIADLELRGAVSAEVASAFNTAHSSGDSSLPRDRGATTGPDSIPSPGTTPRPSTGASPGSPTMQAGSGAILYVSVGGLWGIGDDLVSVPASSLKYNSAEKRFELAANKAAVVALAEQDSDSSATTNRPGSSATAAGKQVFDDEAARVRSALQANPGTSAFASRVTVATEGDKLELRGRVETREQRQQIVDAARRATSLPVEDNIEVRP